MLYISMLGGFFMLTPEGAMRLRQWRATVPFTDEAIAGMLEQIAVWDKERRVELKELARKCRAGYVSAVAVREVTPFLVKVCGICGEKALYHYGVEGRCRVHRQHVPGWYRQPPAARWSGEADVLTAERRERSWERLRSLSRKRR